MLLTKEQSKQLQRDYIPGGKSIDISTLRFYHTKDFEVYQCGRQTTYDPQSGPIYCGGVAEYIAYMGDGKVVCLCERHPPSRHLIDSR